MNYFVTNQLYYQLSGIEIAQKQRLNLFHQHNEAAKIVTVEYSAYGHLNLMHNSLTDRQTINLFDYFQEATVGLVPIETAVTAARLGRLTGNPNVQLFQNRDDGFNYPFVSQQVSSVNWSDPTTGRPLRQDWYDVRGFRSSSHFFDQEGHENWVIYWNYRTQKPAIIHWRRSGSYLLNYQRRQYNFENFIELKRFFFDELVETPNTRFFSDRAETTNAALFQMKHQVIVYIMLHSAHTYDRNQPLTSRLNNSMAFEMQHADRFKGFITGTPRQAQDVQVRTGKPAISIPIGFVNKPISVEQLKSVKQREQTVIYVSRVSREKRIEDFIQIVGQLHAKLPDLRAEIWGYVTDDEYFGELQDQITRLGLKAVVSFKGFTLDLTRVYQRVRLLVLTSRYEAFNLSIIESMTQGTPVAAYDVHYGPKDIIQAGEDGFISESGNINQMVNGITSLLTDDEQWTQFSERAAQNITRFNSEMVWQRWQNLLQNGVQSLQED